MTARAREQEYVGNPITNSYVRELGYVADVQHGDGLVYCSYGVLPAPGAAVVVGAPYFIGERSDSPWGQNVVASGACDVHGYDYLGQPMLETFGAGGAGSKAFMWVTNITNGETATWGSEYGVPYTAKSSTDARGVLTAADATTPTATTGDPRGTVNFVADPDGSTEILFFYLPSTPQADAIKTMHGLRHFYPSTP